MARGARHLELFRAADQPRDGDRIKELCHVPEHKHGVLAKLFRNLHAKVAQPNCINGFGPWRCGVGHPMTGGCLRSGGVPCPQRCGDDALEQPAQGGT